MDNEKDLKNSKDHDEKNTLNQGDDKLDVDANQITEGVKDRISGLNTNEIIQLQGGFTVTIDSLTEALRMKSPIEALSLMKRIIEGVGGDQLKLIVDALEIKMTPSNFIDNPQGVEILKQVASKFPFSRWINEMGLEKSQIKREHVCQWWEAFMQMAEEKGFRPFGQIDNISKKTNLWKATSNLADEMIKDPIKYGHLPALLINHPTEVERVLKVISDPKSFLEILVGERLDDMRTCPEFLRAFSLATKDSDADESDISDVIWTLKLIMQRS